MPKTEAGKEMWRLAEAVAVKLEPDGGGPFVDVAVLAVEMIRNQVDAIEDEARRAVLIELRAAVERLPRYLGNVRHPAGSAVARAAVLALIDERLS